MNDSPRIEMSGVSKRYVKYDDAPLLVTRALRLRTRTTQSDLWALRDINLSVAPGECLGVIGRNGSGKSTMLRLLAGVSAPTIGRVAVRGRVAPLISVGVGFHPELTGRENVYVNGMILGLSRSQVDERFDEIVDFAEIEDFIDTPVKFYSSGMFVRLGFAVSVLAEPEVLLVDEVLAVGDIAFQMKCLTRMTRIKEAGTTLVLVSHNLNAIRSMCDRTVVLHNGIAEHDGDTGDTIALVADLHFFREVDDALLGIAVFDESRNQIYGDSVPWGAPYHFVNGQRARISVTLEPRLASGTYSAHIGIGTADGRVLTRVNPTVTFYVNGGPRTRGIADLRAEFNVTSRGPTV